MIFKSSNQIIQSLTKGQNTLRWMLLSFKHDILSEACAAAWVKWLLLQWTLDTYSAVRRQCIHVPSRYTVVECGSQAVADIFRNFRKISPNTKFLENLQPYCQQRSFAVTTGCEKTLMRVCHGSSPHVS